jgi:hypothetical protein
MLNFGTVNGAGAGADLWTNTAGAAPAVEINTAVAGSDNGILLLQQSPGLQTAQIFMQAFLAVHTVGDGATFDYAELEHYNNYFTWTLYQAGARVQQFSINYTGFMVQDAAGLEQFVIEQNGRIRTNQAQAPGVHLGVVKEVPMYETNTGALIGYVEIKL